MTEYVVTKEIPLEIETTLPCEIRLFKNLTTGKIVGELYVDYNFFGDFTLNERGLACCPDDPEWRKFFEDQFNDYKGVL